MPRSVRDHCPGSSTAAVIDRDLWDGSSATASLFQGRQNRVVNT